MWPLWKSAWRLSSKLNPGLVYYTTIPLLGISRRLGLCVEMESMLCPSSSQRSKSYSALARCGLMADWVCFLPLRVWSKRVSGCGMTEAWKEPMRSSFAFLYPSHISWACLPDGCHPHSHGPEWTCKPVAQPQAGAEQKPAPSGAERQLGSAAISQVEEVCIFSRHVPIPTPSFIISFKWYIWALKLYILMGCPAKLNPCISSSLQFPFPY